MTNDTQRLDKWLWHVRFYRSRALAAKAVSLGQVKVNQQRCKPSRTIKIADQIDVQKKQLRWSVEVLGVLSQRAGATIAQTMYKESDDSVQRRKDLLQLLKQNASIQFGRHKPDSRTRRLAIQRKRGD